MPVTFIAVGSNINPGRNIPRALSQLKRLVKVEAVSTFFQTFALNRSEQNPFYNGVWRIQSERPAREIKFSVLRPIEASLGRVRSSDRDAPRTIDLDIILYGNEIVNDPDLRIPDPEIFTRPFIARPLVEIAPDLVVPGTQIPLSSMEVANATEGLVPLLDFSNQLQSRLNHE